jgi:hypothetical protein
MLCSIVYSKQKSTGKVKNMGKKELAKMKRRVKTLQKQLGQLGPLMRGSVVVIGTRNKQPYFSLNKNKKTHLIYLGKKREDKAREYSQNYQKLLEIVEEMTTINMTLLKENACL